ncbi:bacterio-opsin activator domain-containing protein [Halomarina rubra]|uniref:Bacterio-opsin activator domain-containing protein n=1 Tax=Halomarina rubra TaxID=2071873 RepID=A0ABD6AWB1_9EURY
MTGDAEETLDVLLIEDNPGDARLIEEMLRDVETLLQRVEAADSIAGGVTLSHEQTLTAGLDRVREGTVDVVLLDLDLPESTGLETLATVTDETAFVPVIVLTGLDDEEIGLTAVRHGAQDYLVKREVTSDLLVRSIHYATERNRQVRERARRREQLDTLNRLNRIGQDVTHAVITTSTRDDLIRAVCEQFANSELFRFAWVGGVDHAQDRVAPLAADGIDLNDLTPVQITADDETSPLKSISTAVQTQAVQVAVSGNGTTKVEPWHPERETPAYRSSASVPIIHEGLLYGVLNVYAASDSVFSTSAVETLSRLGEVIGHAITAIERKEALVSDMALEFKFELVGVLEEVITLTNESEARVDVDHFTKSSDGLLSFGEIYGIAREEFQAAIEQTPLVDLLHLNHSGNDVYNFELVTTLGDDFLAAIATHGGRITGATIANTTFQFVVEFPTGPDKRPLIELVEEHCPNVQPVAQRTVERSVTTGSSIRSAVEGELTEKQYTALKTAYLAGMFEWPRENTGEEVATQLGVSAPTFNEHLRIAQRKCFDVVFDDTAKETLPGHSP